MAGRSKPLEAQGGGLVCPAIVGPTAVGKTGLITALAQHFPLEVISLDSRQVYRGLKIGTAQPSSDEQAVCPHHLIDFLSPREKYDAMRFRTDFARVYREIRHRGGVPVLVGGAGMYLSALREGFLEVPGNTPDILAATRDELEQLPDQEIRDRLKSIDPESWNRIHPNDRYRSQRALEVHQISGTSLTELKARQRPQPCLGLEFPTIVLQRPVPLLDQRIAVRTEQMLDQGWVAETEALLETHPGDCPGLQSIGYREIVRFLEGGLDRCDLLSTIVLTTRQYAKRQRTWFRHIPTVAASLPEDPQMVDLLQGFLDPTNGSTSF